jgi:hypothetical protein
MSLAPVNGGSALRSAQPYKLSDDSSLASIAESVSRQREDFACAHAAANGMTETHHRQGAQELTVTVARQTIKQRRILQQRVRTARGLAHVCRAAGWGVVKRSSCASVERRPDWIDRRACRKRMPFEATLRDDAFLHRTHGLPVGSCSATSCSSNPSESQHSTYVHAKV